MYVALAIFIVAIPLGLTSYRVGVEGYAELLVKRFSGEWLSGTSYELVNIVADANGDTEEVIISGDGQPPSVDKLGAHLESNLGKGVG